MKKLVALSGIAFLLLSMLLIGSSRAQITINYGDFTENGWFWQEHFWDLTQCDLTISFTVDLSGHVPPMGQPVWSAIGVAQGAWGEGAWGWIGWGAPYAAETDPDSLDMDDKFNLGAPDRYDESSYDALGPETLVTPPIGNPWVNYGVWFDRDGVDPWQAGYWGAVDGGTYNTGGIYNVVITYHAINETHGTMFNTVNNIMTGFYDDGWKNAQPENYPVGKSITGDLTQLRVFVSVWGDGVKVYNLTVSGCLTTVGISIDIKPGSDPNSINMGDQGSLPVAILGSDILNVYDVNASTINIQGVTLAMRGSPKRPKLAYSYQDVNSDGYTDLIAFFEMQDLVNAGVLTEDTVSLTLSATLYNKQPIEGADSIRIVPP